MTAAEAKVARPRAEVLAEVLDPNRPKTEHEWVAAEEIARLRAQVERMLGVLPNWLRDQRC